ncbi:MAG: PIN domain-containing protein [Clostridiales Family XIII bacterium]|nr:PIN domain-containing protein [Clostridiales Family XIII bacterium]
MKIYLDNCCLNRPFDELSQDRVYLEAEAILSIVARCEKGEWELLGSGVIELELSKLTNAERLEQVQTLYSAARSRIALTAEAESRAAFFQQAGIKPFDSLHLAIAESGGVDVFLTTDDRLLRAASKIELKTRAANPVTWLMEVTNNGR